VFRVCESCGEWIEEIVVSDGAMVCMHCGYSRPFVRLPLFQVTGASGAGKSRVCRDLPAALPECVVLDQDILLTGLPWEQHRKNWLRVAMNIHQGGRSTVLIATQLPEHYESLPERAWFSEIHYLALVCDDAVLGERLRERPAWRGASEERIAEMQTFNEWLKANAAATSPPMTLLDTTGCEPTESVAAVAAWVRARLPRPGEPVGPRSRSSHAKVAPPR
jgi:broad-specificity NMP kinase